MDCQADDRILTMDRPKRLSIMVPSITVACRLSPAKFSSLSHFRSTSYYVCFPVVELSRSCSVDSVRRPLALCARHVRCSSAVRPLFDNSSPSRPSLPSSYLLCTFLTVTIFFQLHFFILAAQEIILVLAWQLDNWLIFEVVWLSTESKSLASNVQLKLFNIYIFLLLHSNNMVNWKSCWRKLGM